MFMCLQQFVIRVSGEDMWKLSICQALNDCHLGNKQTLSKVEWKEVVIKFAINTTRWLTTLPFYLWSEWLLLLLFKAPTYFSAMFEDKSLCIYINNLCRYLNNYP